MNTKRDTEIEVDPEGIFPRERPARLVGKLILIIDLIPYGECFWVKACRKTGCRTFLFRAGVVVSQQLRQARILPVWAIMDRVEGKHQQPGHFYYKLRMANTVAIDNTNISHMKTINGKRRKNAAQKKQTQTKKTAAQP
jgi:hypothetical protein